MDLVDVSAALARAAVTWNDLGWITRLWPARWSSKVSSPVTTRAARGLQALPLPEVVAAVHGQIEGLHG